VTDLRITGLWTDTQRLRAAVRSTFEAAAHPRCRELAGTLPEEVNPVISLAFIGQYNAGKSSLIRALTGTTDVVVDANVATDHVVEVAWQGLRLIDTPGVQAGRPAHDHITETAIASADLLVFVVTAELFDATIADYFREVVLDRGRGGECLLVVNKSSQDAGTRETKLAAIAEVLDPLSPDDVPTIFTDALSREWADQSDDEEERRELLEESGFFELATRIDEFARGSGLRGQLTTPVYEALNVIDETAAVLADDAETRATIEMLRRQRSVLREHRRELDEQVREAIVDTRNRIASLGDELADRVTADTEAAALQAAVDERSEVAERYAHELDDVIERAIDEASSRLQSALASQSQLALEFLAGTDGAASTGHITLRADVEAAGGGDAFPTQTLQGLKQALTKTSTFFSQNARGGEKGHALVYGVGKKLGVKFRPWGAVKTARFLGRAAGVLAVAAAAADIWNQHQQEKREAAEEEELQKWRVGLRSAFQMLASDMAEQTSSAFSHYLHTSYDAALDFVDRTIGDLVAERSGSSEVLDRLTGLSQQLHDLLAQIRGSNLELGHGQAPLVEPTSS
jgi:GTPase SAR1 family protein